MELLRGGGVWAGYGLHPVLVWAGAGLRRQEHQHRDEGRRGKHRLLDGKKLQTQDRDRSMSQYLKRHSPEMISTFKKNIVEHPL